MPKSPAPPFDRDRRPVVALFRSPLFNPSETFVKAHATGLMRYQPLLLGLEDKGNIPATLAGRVMLKRAWGWRALAERARRRRPLLLHAHFGTDGLRALRLADLLGVPLITTLHGYDVMRSRRALLLSGRRSWVHYGLRERVLQRRGDLFLAVSEALRLRAIARGYPEARTLVQYNGVDLAGFPSGPGGPDTILFVGRLVEKKGVETLLRAFALILRERPAASLVIIGDGPLRARLERLGGESVRFLGHQAPATIAEWMRRSTVLAAPSVTARDGDAEGLPMVLLEAAASALPTVGTNHQGIPEAIVEGETGFIVPERDAEALGARLTTILADPERRNRMGAAARALAETKFDFARQMHRLEELYDEVRAGRCG